MAAQKRKDSKGRNLKENEFQRSDGQYMYRYYDANGSMKYVYSWKLVPTDKVPSGKRDGLSLREKEAEIAEDKQKGIDSAAKKKYTLNDIFEKYIAGKTELKPSTRTNYLYMYNNYVRNTLGKRKIADIKYSDIKEYYNTLINERKFQPNSLEIIHTILHPTFTQAVRDDIISKNPTDGVMSEIKKSRKWTKPKRHALTLEQQQLFMDFVHNSSTYKHWEPLFVVFLGTGCRVGELVGLTWDDVDTTNNMIKIDHNLIYRPQEGSGKCEMHITTPKTSSGIRRIPMMQEVKEAFEELRKQQAAQGFCDVEIDGYKGFIFINRDGNVHNPHAINRAIERIRIACNAAEKEQAKAEKREAIEITHFSVHNLRHTFCTRFCENETNIKVIQEIMGHSDISTTMNIYAEATEAKKKDTINCLDNNYRILPLKAV